MIPGSVSKMAECSLAAATTIVPTAELCFVSGTTSVATIVPPLGIGSSQALYIVATDAAGFATTTAGNIALVVSLTTSKVTMFVWSKKNAKWYPGAIS